MEYVEIVKNVFLAPAAIGIYATIVGILFSYWFNNYFDKPKIKAIAYTVAVEIEKQTIEGNPIDIFINEFIKKVKIEKGRKPNAGELKTGVDFANKTLSLEYNKKF